MITTPEQLSIALKQIVVEATRCHGVWREGRITGHEMYKIRAACEKLLRATHTDAVDAEINARTRVSGIEREIWTI